MKVNWEPIRDMLIGTYVMFVTFLVYDFIRDMTYAERAGVSETIDCLSQALVVFQ